MGSCKVRDEISVEVNVCRTYFCIFLFLYYFFKAVHKLVDYIMLPDWTIIILVTVSRDPSLLFVELAELALGELEFPLDHYPKG